MNVFMRKLWRDLRQQKGSTIAVLVVAALGVLLLVASAGAYEDLRDSYAATRVRLALAGLHVDAASVTEADRAAVAALPDVAIAETRAVAEVPVAPSKKVPGLRATLRILSLPDSGEPALDRTLVIEGALPAGDGEVLVEKHFATRHGLASGSALDVGPGVSLRVSGVAVSAEYLWVARDETDFMTSPDELGVAWMRRGALRGLATTLLARGDEALASPALRIAASDGMGDQLLVQPVEGVAPAKLVAGVRGVLGERALRETAADDLVGVKLLQMDVDGYRGMAAFFPLFFLTVAAFILASALARTVDAQRSIIGTWLALGVRRSRILVHYLSYALVLGVGGAILGGLAGLALAPEMTREYATELNIPFVDAHMHLDLLGLGVLVGAGTSLLAAAVPVFRVLHLTPAEAMRPPRPSIGALARLARRLPSPLVVKLALRELLGRPMRSLGTLLGVAAAVVLVLSTGAMLDSMKATFSSLFDKAQSYDVRVDFAAPVPAGDAKEKLAKIEGVRAAEAFLAMPVKIESGARSAEVLVQALPAGATLVRSVDADGSDAPPGAGGVTITRATAKKLGVDPGAAVRVRPLGGGGGDGIELRVTGFADAAMGSVATVWRADVDGAFGTKDLATSVVGDVSGGPAALREKLSAAFPEAVRVEMTAATREQFRDLMGLGWVMLGAMLLFGGILASAILFNTATLGVLDRMRELSTLRALGLSMGEIVGIVTVQHALLALAGIAAGIPLAALASRAMLDAFSSELFGLPFVFAAKTIGATAVGIFVLALIAEWPALRLVARTNLAEAVRAREG